MAACAACGPARETRATRSSRDIGPTDAPFSATYHALLSAIAKPFQESKKQQSRSAPVASEAPAGKSSGRAEVRTMTLVFCHAGAERRERQRPQRRPGSCFAQRTFTDIRGGACSWNSQAL